MSKKATIIFYTILGVVLSSPLFAEWTFPSKAALGVSVQSPFKTVDNSRVLNGLNNSIWSTNFIFGQEFSYSGFFDQLNLKVGEISSPKGFSWGYLSTLENYIGYEVFNWESRVKISPILGVNISNDHFVSNNPALSSFENPNSLDINRISANLNSGLRLGFYTQKTDVGNLYTEIFATYNRAFKQAWYSGANKVTGLKSQIHSMNVSMQMGGIF